MKIYFLYHEVHVTPECFDVKGIGAYTSADSMSSAMERLKTLPGFCVHPTGFRVFVSSLTNGPASGTSTFVLYHVPDPNDEQCGLENVRVVGLFASREEAESVAARLRTFPQYSDPFGTFDVVESVLDHTDWSSGFGV